MDGEEICETFNASGSAGTKFSAGIYKHEEIKQENFDGWDAAAFIINYLEFVLLIVISFIRMASLGLFNFRPSVYDLLFIFTQRKWHSYLMK